MLCVVLYQLPGWAADVLEANKQIHSKPDRDFGHNAKYERNPAMPHAIGFGLIQNPDRQHTPACDGIHGIPSRERIYEASSKMQR